MGELGIPKPTITVEPLNENDLREALMGAQGNPTYEQQFGITSAPLGSPGFTQPSIAELELQAQQALARATNPLAYASQGTDAFLGSPTQDQVNYAAELQKFQKLYGESENEKGQLRKNQQELMEAFNGLMAQHEALMATANQPRFGPPAPPQYSPQFNGPQYGNPFEQINDEAFIEGKVFKQFMETQVAPAFSFAAQQAQENAARVAQLEQQMLAQARVNSGVSKLDEYRITSKNPWINRLPAGERLAAIQSLKEVNATQAPVQQPVVPSAPQADSQQRILNKVTYIEGSTPNVGDDTQAALEAAKQRDYAMAMNLPAETGERARAIRAVANKYNIQLGQNPSDLSR